jgi:hypothetical protein
MRAPAHERKVARREYDERPRDQEREETELRGAGRPG